MCFRKTSQEQKGGLDLPAQGGAAPGELHRLRSVAGLDEREAPAPRALQPLRAGPARRGHRVVEEPFSQFPQTTITVLALLNALHASLFWCDEAARSLRRA